MSHQLALHRNPAPDRMPAFQRQIESEGFGEMFGEYMASLQVLPRDWFRDNDPIRFRAAALPQVHWPPLDESPGAQTAPPEDRGSDPRRQQP